MSFSSRIACEGNHGQSHSQAVHRGGLRHGCGHVAALGHCVVDDGVPAEVKKKPENLEFLEPLEMMAFRRSVLSSDVFYFHHEILGNDPI